MNPKIFELSQKLDTFKELLQKALAPSDWSGIEKAHNPEGVEAVEVTPYLQQHANAHPHYKKMLADPQEYKGRSQVTGGEASKKIFHRRVAEDVPGVRAGYHSYMVKPFHSKFHRNTLHHGASPISGWATMATHGLFHAAGMGNNVEDVSVHEHKGVPVTIHRFNEGARSSANEALKYPEGLKLMAQGSIIDFLTGNTDRHNQNVMSFRPENAKHNEPLFIDNERGFQYKNTVRGVQGLPVASDKIAHQIQRHSNYNPKLESIPEHEVRDWWDDHKRAIKDEFYRHLKNIKDPHLRGHIEANFNQRMSHVDDILGNGAFQERFSDYDIGVHIIPKAKKPKKSLESINQIKANLPPDPLAAIHLLDESAKGRSPSVREKLREVAMDLLPKLNPDQLAEAYKHFSKNDAQFSGLGYDILKHVHESGNKEAQNKLLDFHRQAMISHGLDPEATTYHYGVGLPPHWADLYRGIKS